MNYKTLFGTVALLALITSSGWGQLVDRIEIKVNDDIITKSEIAENINLVKMTRNLEGLSAREEAQIEKNIRAKMVEDLLLVQEAKRQGITLQQKEMEAYAAVEISKLKATYDTTEEFEADLVKAGFAPETFLYDYSRMLERDVYIKRLLRTLTRKAEVTPDEVKYYTQAYPEEAARKTTVGLRQILFLCPRDADETEVKTTHDKAEKILYNLKAGAKFAAVAQAVTEHQDSRANGGYIGNIRKGELYSEFDVVFDLDKGDITDLIRTDLGFHILKVVEINSVERYLLTIKSQQIIKEWLEELRENAAVQEHG